MRLSSRSLAVAAVVLPLLALAGPGAAAPSPTVAVTVDPVTTPPLTRTGTTSSVAHVAALVVLRMRR